MLAFETIEKNNNYSTIVSVSSNISGLLEGDELSAVVAGVHGVLAGGNTEGDTVDSTGTDARESKAS